jgi:phospholipid-binding lipoprotein MlaA
MTPTTGKHLVACLAVSGLLLGGCGARPPIVEGDKPEEPVFPADYVLQDDVEYIEKIKDPWQGLNRGIYRFNYRFDQYVLLPAVIGYKKITPNFVEKGLHNFFTNFTNFTRIFNCILQGSPRKTIDTTGRLLVNTTVGIGGLLDPATAMGIPQHYEDFGQTLGVWGVGPGPYLMVPALGPTTVRDGVGRVVDIAFNPLTWILWDLPTVEQFTPVMAVVVTTHESIMDELQSMRETSPDFYASVRDIYLQKRASDIANGAAAPDAVLEPINQQY